MNDLLLPPRDRFLLFRIRLITAFFMGALFLSGITAIPLQNELQILVSLFSQGHPPSALGDWLLRVQSAVDGQARQWPFLALGTDWLAFGHIVIALGFIGLLRDPVRNEWLMTWGFLACLLVLPWAWGFGLLRGIPWGWRLIDCSFGVGGMVPLLLIRHDLQELKMRPNKTGLTAADKVGRCTNSLMKIFLIILGLALGGAGFYGYQHNPEGCKKLGNDFASSASVIKADVVTVYTVSGPSAMPDQRHPVSIASSVTVSSVGTAPSVSAVPSAWTPPRPIPSAPDWTWTTSSGTFRNVRILKVEADCVTIMHADGGGLVPIASLSPDLQKQLNYDPAAASAAAVQRQQDDAATRDAIAQEKAAQFAGGTVDYNAALAQARVAGKLVLLHFTGSDWCPTCKLLESEVMSTPAFQQFSAANYIIVTLDFPRNIAQPDSLKQQNNQLSQKYNIQGYPTLVVIDGNERELGRTSGYMGPGADPTIEALQGYNNKR